MRISFESEVWGWGYILGKYSSAAPRALWNWQQSSCLIMWGRFNKLQESHVMEYRAAIKIHVVGRGLIIVIGECS